MNQIVIALLIGIVAGIIDVVPMFFMKNTDKYACASAFIHWVVLGLIIPFVQWEIQPWLKGLIIGVIAAVPVILMIFKSDKKSTIPILLFSAVLGIGVGIAGATFIN
jgi:Mn2+/Fe2+ NRAMP family transporter